MSTDLNTTILALQIKQGVKFVKVKFHKENGDFDLNGPIDDDCDDTGIWSSANYIYKVDPDLYEELKEGSFVVVQARSHMQVVKVVDIDCEIDFGDKRLTQNLRWVICDVTARLQHVHELSRKELGAKRTITNARLLRESQDILAAANLSSEDIQLISGTVVAHGSMQKPEAKAKPEKPYESDFDGNADADTIEATAVADVEDEG